MTDFNFNNLKDVTVDEAAVKAQIGEKQIDVKVQDAKKAQDEENQAVPFDV